MKTKFCLLFLIFISFVLMGCPAGSFYRYTFVSTSDDQQSYGDTRIHYDSETELHISCGNYVQFVGTKDRGLLVTVKVISKVLSENEAYIEKVVSSNFGELQRKQFLESSQYMVRDTLNTLYYNLSLKDFSHRKIRKKIHNDTISIVLKNGNSLFFVKKEPY